MYKRILGTLFLIGSIITACSMHVQAKQANILTLGEDLSEDQRQLIIDYLNVDESQVIEIVVTNEDEHRYLDEIMTPEEIGSHTYSCSYIEITESGGIHVRTVNIGSVTSEMIRNALVTSGITNANIICVAPMEVSGTGALAGVFKAYEQLSVNGLDENKMNLASEELEQTLSLSKVIGSETATSIIKQLKEEIINNNLSEDEIRQRVRQYTDIFGERVTEEQINNLVNLLIGISYNNYNINDMQNAYNNIEALFDICDIPTQEVTTKFSEIGDFFKNIWSKLWGGNTENSQLDAFNNTKNQLGILAQTNDDLIGDSVVVTDTDGDAIKAVQEYNKELYGDNYEQIVIEEKEDNIFQKIANVFKNNSKEETDSSEEQEQYNSSDEQYDDEQVSNYNQTDSSFDEAYNKSLLAVLIWYLDHEDSTMYIEEIHATSPTLDELVK